MATVHRRILKSKFYYAAWRDRRGRQFLRSTGQTEKRKALEVALGFEAAQREADGPGGLTEARAKMVLNDILRRTGSVETLPQPPAIEEFFRDWLSSKQGLKAERGIERYRIAVDHFLGFLGERQAHRIDTLRPRDVETFLTSRLHGGVAINTATLDVKILRTALNRAVRQGVLDRNPTAGVDLPTARPTERETFTQAEISQLVAAARGEWRTVVLLAYYSGQRLGDCVALEWPAVNLAEALMTFKQRKTGEKVVTPIHPQLLEHLRGLQATDGPVMPGLCERGTGGRTGLSETFKRLMRDAGISTGSVQGPGLRRLSTKSFHGLRHSFATELANRGVAQETRMLLTGHRTVSAHKTYTHPELQNLRDAIAKLPSITTTP